MGRGLTSTQQTATSGPVTQPHHLVEIAFSTPLRMSDGETQTHNGNTFNAADVEVLGVDLEGVGQGGEVVIGNSDLSAGSLMLNEKIVDRQIKIWQYWPGVSPVLIAVCAAGSSSLDSARNVLRIGLETEGLNSQLVPNEYMTPANGFNHLPRVGSTFVWNNLRIKLEED